MTPICSSCRRALVRTSAVNGRRLVCPWPACRGHDPERAAAGATLAEEREIARLTRKWGAA